MDNGKKVGIIIIIALIASICLSAYAGIVENTSATNTTQTLNKNTLNINDSFEPEVINLNINQEGLYKINFTDSEDIATITSTKGDNSQTINVTNTSDGNNLNISIDSDTDSNVLTLSNKYRYNINVKSITGGYDIDVPANAHIESLNTVLGIGGVNLNLQGGLLDNYQNQITIGGLSIQGSNSGLANINSTIAIGGLEVVVDEPLTIHSDVLFGGSQMNKTETNNNTTIDYTDSAYASAENRMNLSSNIQIGGITA